MAYSHHHHHQNTTSTTTTNGCCCCCTNCTHHCPPWDFRSPPSSATEPLLQAFVSHFLLQQQQQNQAAPCKCQTHKAHQKHHFQHQKKHFHYQQQEPEPEPDYQQQARFVLSSLLSRIDALEASLHKFSLSSAHNHYSSRYLRDAAARVIQTHFRAFLVRRSRTLRQLKELAFIKSRFNSLKVSISKRTHFDFRVVSQKATDLLLKLDSIQGGDPMVRDGKRSIRTEIVKFLEFVDGFLVKRQEASFKAAKNVKITGTGKNRTRINIGSNYGGLGRDQSEIMEDLRDRIERIHGFSKVSKGEDEDVEFEGFHQLIDDKEVEEEEEAENPRISRNRNGVLLKRHGMERLVQAQPRVKKSVSFSENGNVIRVFGNDSNSEPSSSRDDSVSSEDDGQVVENLQAEVEATKGSSKEREDGEEEYLENGGRYEIVGNYNGEDGSFPFSAPLPVKMESRADLMKKRKAVKIIT